MNISTGNAKEVLVIKDGETPSIEFKDAEGNTVGILRIDGGEFAFDGNPFDSAKAFLEAVNALLPQWVESLKDAK